MGAAACIKWQDGAVKQLSQDGDPDVAARRAAIDRSSAFCDSARVGRAALKPTFRALSLRKQKIDTFSQH
jgi:hypothetical protein